MTGMKGVTVALTVIIMRTRTICVSFLNEFNLMARSPNSAVFPPAHYAPTAPGAGKTDSKLAEMVQAAVHAEIAWAAPQI